MLLSREQRWMWQGETPAERKSETRVQAVLSSISPLTGFVIDARVEPLRFMPSCLSNCDRLFAGRLSVVC